MCMMLVEDASSLDIFVCLATGSLPYVTGA
jgi:hypothetical protein